MDCITTENLHGRCEFHIRWDGGSADSVMSTCRASRRLSSTPQFVSFYIQETDTAQQSLIPLARQPLITTVFANRSV